MGKTRLNLFQEGIGLFNQGKYFEAHETLEDYWNEIEPGDLKQTIQGIIQCAAALHLLEQQRIVGAQKVWARAQKNFENNTESHTIDLDKLIRDMSKIFAGFSSESEINVKIALR